MTIRTTRGFASATRSARTRRRSRASAPTTTSAETRAGLTDPATNHGSYREDDGGGEDEAADEAMGDRQNQDRELFAGDPHRREAREEAPDAEQELDPEQDEEHERDGDGDRVARPPHPRGDHRYVGEHRDGAGQVQVDTPGVSQERAE